MPQLLLRWNISGSHFTAKISLKRKEEREDAANFVLAL